MGYQLRHPVTHSVRNIKRPAHVPDRAARRHCTEGHYLGNPVPAVFLHHIVYNLFTVDIAEIYIEIRH